MTNTRTLMRTCAVLVALAAVAFGALSFARPAAAGPNVTGTWEIHTTGDLPGTCASIIMQDGTSLTSYAECIVTLNLTGTINPANGVFSMVDPTYDAVITGIFSADGNSVSASYSGLGGTFNGTLTGTRTSTDVAVVDLTGDWTFAFVGRAPGDTLCDAVLTQSSADLTAVVTCASGTKTWVGTASPLSGAFSLNIAEAESHSNIFAAPMGDSSGAMSGNWTTGDREAYGAFYAFPAGQPRPAILSIGCASEFGGPGYCYGDPGDTLTATVTLVAPPSEGYDGYQLALRTSGNVPYVAADDPATEAPGCSNVERTISPLDDETTITFTCAPGNAIDGASALVQIAFQCPEEPYAYTGLDLTEDGTFLSLGGAQSIPLQPWSASIDCYDPEEPPYPYPEPPPPGGPYPSLPPEAWVAADVNCDGRPDAIDAALVLQLGAGLIGSLPCSASGDSTMDGATNSIDASVILQMAAGLVYRAPAVGPPAP